MLKLGDVFPTPEYLVVGMEYANAKTLEKVLRHQDERNGSRSLLYPLAIFFFQQLVLTLDFCNQNSVNFQGLHPKYVLISKDKRGNPLLKLGVGGFHNANEVRSSMNCASSLASVRCLWQWPDANACATVKVERFYLYMRNEAVK
jgi:serine/threonine protein kinase